MPAPLVVLGAGADVPFELPTVPDLVRELATFSRTDGQVINKTLRKKIPHVRLNFERVGGDAIRLAFRTRILLREVGVAPRSGRMVARTGRRRR
jgi:hypothetical protein